MGMLQTGDILEVLINNPNHSLAKVGDILTVIKPDGFDQRFPKNFLTNNLRSLGSQWLFDTDHILKGCFRIITASQAAALKSTGNPFLKAANSPPPQPAKSYLQIGDKLSVMSSRWGSMLQGETLTVLHPDGYDPTLPEAFITDDPNHPNFKLHFELKSIRSGDLVIPNSLLANARLINTALPPNAATAPTLNPPKYPILNVGDEIEVLSQPGKTMAEPPGTILKVTKGNGYSQAVPSWFLTADSKGNPDCMAWDSIWIGVSFKVVSQQGQGLPGQPTLQKFTTGSGIYVAPGAVALGGGGGQGSSPAPLPGWPPLGRAARSSRNLFRVGDQVVALDIPGISPSTIVAGQVYIVSEIYDNGALLVLQGKPMMRYLSCLFRLADADGAAKPMDIGPHTCRWQRYIGFTQRYDFCEVCDAKREVAQ